MKLADIKDNTRAAFYLKHRAAYSHITTGRAWELAGRDVGLVERRAREYEESKEALATMWQGLGMVEPKRYSPAGEALQEARTTERGRLSTLASVRAYAPASLAAAKPGGHCGDESGGAWYYMASDDGAGVFRGVMAAHDAGPVDHTGWYTNSHGESFKDGSGKCWGIVVHLPGRQGQELWLAGYQFGGQCEGAQVHLGDVYSDKESAALAADSHAESAADSERDYQDAWEAGRDYADHAETVQTTRQETLALLKQNRDSGGSRDLPAIHATICKAVCDARGRIVAARESMAELAGGYFNKRQEAAFCEAAGLDAMPGAMG